MLVAFVFLGQRQEAEPMQGLLPDGQALKVAADREVSLKLDGELVGETAPQRADLETGMDSAERGLAERVEPPAPLEERVSPEPEPVILGMVIDHLSGAPIAGAEIFMGSFVRTLVETDSEGLFALPLENSVLWWTRARADGYFARQLPLHWEAVLEKRDGRVVVELSPSGRIVGTVVTTHGKPVTSGRVYAFPAGSPQTSWMEYRGAELREDPWSQSIASAIGGMRPLNPDLALAIYDELDGEGHFELASLPELPTTPGSPRPTYDLVVRSDEVVMTGLPNVEVGPGETREVEIQAQQASRIEGRLRLPPGTMAASSELWFCWHENHLDREPPNGRGWLGKDRVVRIGETGSFNSGSLWPSEHVRIRAVLPLEAFKDVVMTPPIYTWDLSLEAVTVKTVELAPGDDVRYPSE